MDDLTIHERSTVSCPMEEHDGAFDASLVGQPASRIATPHLDAILDAQQLSVGDKEKVCVLLGRLLYAHGEHDAWKRVLHIWGPGPSGKTTLVNLARSFFRPDGTFLLSKHNYATSDVVKSASASSFYACYEFEVRVGGSCAWQAASVCTSSKPHVGMLFRLPPAPMVQGNMLTDRQLAVLSGAKVPRNPQGHPTHGLLVGNVPADSPHLVSVPFKHAVPHAAMDTNLGAKLREEMPTILYKCATAYRAWVADGKPCPTF